ncbi:MAG: potassium channel family protein [Pseudomonadales bacterium]|jgi:hypothetical protein
MRPAKLPFGFETLLGTMLLLMFLPTLAHADWVSTISRTLYTAVMLASLYLVADNHKELTIGIILFIPAALTKWMAAPLLEEEIQLFAHCIFQIIFLAYIMRKTFRFLLSTKTVDSDTISASIVLYFIFGLCMSLAYFATLLVSPGALGPKLMVDISKPDALAVLMHDLIYFSFVTQTTLGYGDISPTTGFAKSLASTQALSGQIYVAVIIARLVGIQIATTLDGSQNKD